MQNRSVSPAPPHSLEPVFQKINRPPLHVTVRRPLWYGEKELHWHDRLEIGYCFSGSGIYYIRNEIYPYSQGDVVIVYPGDKHDARNFRGGDCSWRFVMTDLPALFGSWPDGDRLLALTDYTRYRSRICSQAERKQVLPYLLRLFELRDTSPAETGITPQMCHQLACLIYETEAYLTLAEEGISVSEISPALQQVVYPAVSYMLDHYAEPVRIADLCALSYSSECHLRRSFTAAFGLSPTEFLHKIRLLHACSSLTVSDKPILSIAEQCGYPSISSFNRQFQKWMHMSPMAYRKAFQDWQV